MMEDQRGRPGGGSPDVVPERMRSGRGHIPVRTAVDAKLMERTGLDELSLRRLRKEFLVRSGKLTYLDRRALAEGGAAPRLQFMISVVNDLWTEERWNAWLQYLEHTQKDVDEMCRGDYPISPYLTRVFSALFGIKTDFLQVGASPTVDRVGASIDIWPLTGIR